MVTLMMTYATEMQSARSAQGFSRTTSMAKNGLNV